MGRTPKRSIAKSKQKKHELSDEQLDKVSGGMNFDADLSSIRSGSVSADFSVGRGAQPVGVPKKTFGQ